MAERFWMRPIRAAALGSGMAVALFAAPFAVAQGNGPSYADAVNCAAVTQAAGKLAEGTKDEATHFDQYVHWSMAAADAGRASGKTARAVDGEVAGRSATALTQLRAKNGATLGELAQCAARVPALK